MLKVNPCLNCGACCAYCRVSFSEKETIGETGVPLELIEAIPESRCVMKGTNQEHPRCIGLEGTIGIDAKCGLYERRPSPCRKFGIQWNNGQATISGRDLVFCNRARAKHDLARLSRKRLTLVLPEYDNETEEQA